MDALISASISITDASFIRFKTCIVVIAFMTICIAAIGIDDKGKEAIVFATDHMVSYPQMGQFEKTIDKYKKLNTNTVAMLSGNPLIFETLIGKCRKECSFDEIAQTIQSSMIELKEQIIQKQLLDIYKINYDYLKEVLKAPIPNPYIDNLLRAISGFSLQTSILLIGFKDDTAQIAEIIENAISNLRDIAFGAIGSGAVQALNTLLFQGQSSNDSLAATLYNVYKAKRNAEVSVGVGKETDIMILTKAGLTEINDDNIKILSTIYESELKFGKTNEKVKEMLNSTLK